MGIIEYTSGAGIAAHRAVMKSAAEAQQLVYKAAVQATGLDRSADFEGEFERAFIHHHGVEAFEMDTFRATERLIDLIQEEGERRVPVFSVVYNPPNLERPEINPGRSTSLSIVESGALALMSTVETVKEAAPNEGEEPKAITERRLHLRTDTATVHYDFTKPQLLLPPTIEEASIGDVLWLSVDQRGESGQDGYVADRRRAMFGKRIFERMGSHCGNTTIVGWDKIHRHLLYLASSSITGDNDPFGGSTPPEHFPSPTQQSELFKALSNGLDLQAPETEQVEKIQERLAKTADRAAAS